jgi:hypothetical protein
MPYRSPRESIAGETGTTSVDLEWSRAGEAGESPHESLVRTVNKIFDTDDSRYSAYRKLYEIYGADMRARGGHCTSEEKAFNGTLSMNELANTIETLHSQLFKNRVIVSVATIGGNWSQQSRARQAGRWLLGVFDDNELHEEKVIRAGLAGLCTGTGLFRVGYEVVDHKKKLARITINHVDPLDIGVDPLDAESGNPWCIYERGWADRQSLYEQFCCDDDESLYGSIEDRKAAVVGAKRLKDDARSVNSGILDNDIVVIYEAWRRPTANGKGGRYVLCTDAGTLIDREYTIPTLSHVPMRLFPGHNGFYGQSAVARLAPGQRTYDKLNERGDEAHDLLGKPTIILQKGSGINKAHIDDEIGTILEADNVNGIIPWTPPPMHPDFYRERDSLPQKMRGIVGVNQMSATGQLPTQLREASGVALEGWQDSESARHAMSHRGYETAMVRLSYLVFETAAWLQKHGYDVQVLSMKGNTLEKINFSEVQMDRETFRLRALPISQLSQSFTGRLNQLIASKREGAITLSQFQELLQVPDTESANDLITAPEEVIMSTLAHIYETGETVELLSFDDPKLVIQKGIPFIHRLRLQKNPPKDHVRNLVQVIAYVDSAYQRLREQMAAQSPPPAPPMDPGMMDPGMMDPGMMDPGTMDPGMMDPGMAEAGPIDPTMAPAVPPVQM